MPVCFVFGMTITLVGFRSKLFQVFRYTAKFVAEIVDVLKPIDKLLVPLLFRSREINTFSCCLMLNLIKEI